MSSIGREEIVETFDALSAALDRALALDVEALTTPELLAMLARCEVIRRRLPAVEHPMINQLGTHGDPAEMGGTLRNALANRLHVTRGEARRRIADAELLGPRCTMSGEALDPRLPATAAAQRAGTLGEAHVAVIRGFFDYLPATIDPATRAGCETRLADLGTRFRPDELTRLAQRMADRLHSDGNYSEDERALRRGITLGRQRRDGMTPITGFLDPAARAALDAVLARWAAPGMCNPADEYPCVSGTPSQDAIQSDWRGVAQRNHDALAAMCRAMLASGDLGQHNGLPASLIISASLKELLTGTGKAYTGGGTWLPMRDVIRIASHAHLYLRIFDGAKELALFHTKRLASPGQRIVLYARDRGCTHPNCPMPGYYCEAHHVNDHARTGRTDIDDLTFRCGPDHELLTSGGYTTRTTAHGDIETLPPPHLDHGQARTNYYHHPEKLLQDNESDDDEDGDP